MGLFDSFYPTLAYPPCLCQASTRSASIRNHPGSHVSLIEKRPFKPAEVAVRRAHDQVLITVPVPVNDRDHGAVGHGRDIECFGGSKFAATDIPPDNDRS